MLEGVVISESKAQKDELILEGTDVQNVSQSGVCISLQFIAMTLTLLVQPRQFRAYAVYGTRISVNSWTVSTYRRRVRLTRSERIAAVDVRVCFRSKPCMLSIILLVMTTMMHATSLYCQI